MKNADSKADIIEAKLKKVLRFIGRNSGRAVLYGHRYKFGALKRSTNVIEYNAKSGALRITGYNAYITRNVNQVLSKTSQYREEALRALFNGLKEEVREVGQKKMKADALTEYLKSKNVPLSL